MKKLYSSLVIFLMGFLFTYTPALTFLNANVNFGSLLKNLVDLVGVAMMLFGAYQSIKFWRGDKNN